MNSRRPDGEAQLSERIENATVEIQHHQGTLCVYAEDGKCLLTISGLPTLGADGKRLVRDSDELTIEVLTSAESRPEGPYFATMKRIPDSPSGLDPKSVLKQAGATLSPEHGDQH